VSFSNPVAAFENMVMLREALDSRGVRIFLNFGTLLGAIREGDFIPHDHDVDMGIFESDLDQFLGVLPELARRGLELRDTWPNKRCYSLQRAGEQIDVFTTRRQSSLFGHRWNLDGKVSLSGAHLDSLDSIGFRGEVFSVPHDPAGVLLHLYGKTWRIPIDGKVSKIDFSSRLVSALRSPFKTLRYLPTFVGNRIKWALAARRSGSITEKRR